MGDQAEALRQLAEEYPHQRLEAQVAHHQEHGGERVVAHFGKRQEEQRDGDEGDERAEVPAPFVTASKGHDGHEDDYGGESGGQQHGDLVAYVRGGHDVLDGRLPQRAQRHAEHEHGNAEAQEELGMVHRKRFEDGNLVALGIRRRRFVPEDGELQQRDDAREDAGDGERPVMQADGVHPDGDGDGDGRVQHDGSAVAARERPTPQNRIRMAEPMPVMTPTPLPAPGR